ncbi:MAG: stage III sporulation protein AB [Lachnospiraceae bacterium]|nr:stage III sporulation protein AB [Lachnospiraceae bacterium]
MKIIGAALCVFSCFVIGFYMGENIKIRYNSLIEIKKMISMIMGEIEYKRNSISEAFYFVAKKMDEPYKSFLMELYNKTLNTEGVFEEIWICSVKKHLSKHKLTEKDFEYLDILGKNIGYLGIDMQISNFQNYIRNTQEEIEKIKGEMDKSIKLYRTLGLMAGIAISIILI